jgi:hypothetical protein
LAQWKNCWGDFMSLVATFAGRMYGIGSGEAEHRLLAVAGKDVG